MAFQSTVNFAQGAGVVGELFVQSPRIALEYILNSADAAYNVFGRCFTVVSQGVAEAGNPDEDAIFAGFLVNPKGSTTSGTVAGGSLAPTLTLPNYSQGELLTEGIIWVSLPAAAAIGDLVVYDNTTGALSTIAPDAALPTGKSFAYAEVYAFTVAAAGLAVVRVDTSIPVPQPAP